MQVAKYNASGNDFVIFHTFIKKDYSELAKKLCHRQEGIGADGLIVLLPHEEVDFQWLFYNSDGSDAAMCGNGTRACAHYAYNRGLAFEQMRFLTQAGVIESTVQGAVVESQLTAVHMIREKFFQEGKEWHFYDTGVPHLVCFVDDLDEFDLSLASKMRHEHNANVNFASVIDDDLHVRTYERGVEGETGACGTGVAACFYAAFKLQKLGKSAKVYPTSQEQLNLRIDESGKIFFKGVVHNVFNTDLDL